MTFPVDDPLHLPTRNRKIEDCANRTRSPASALNEFLLRIEDVGLHEGDKFLDRRGRLVLYGFQTLSPCDWIQRFVEGSDAAKWDKYQFIFSSTASLPLCG